MYNQLRLRKPNRRLIVLALILVLAMYVLIPQFGDFKSSWQLLRRPDRSWALLAVIFTALTYTAAAGTYYFLAFKKLPYRQLTLVQLAAMFVNRLLPGGIGALGANFLYLRQRRHSSAQAATIVGINNVLGFLGHTLLFVITLLVFSNQALAHDSQRGSTLRILGFVAGVTVLIGVVGWLIGRTRFKHWLQDVKRQLLSYRRRPLRLLAALTSSMLLTTCNALCLYACAMAVGIDLSFVAMLLILSFGVGAGVATPTPGGLGGFEAGLVAGFVAYDVSSSAALAAALLYRLISYWLALAAGAMAFVIVQRRSLLGG